MTTHEILVAARNLIDREGWAHRKPSGWVFETGKSHSSCASNAIARVDRVGLSAHRAFAEAIDGRWPAEIFDWNDAPGRTKEEVLAAFDKAIAETAPPPADPFPAGPVGRASFREPVRS